MFKLQAVAAAGVVLLIFIAHHLAPRRKIFFLFSFLIVATAGAFFFYQARPSANDPLTAEERAQRAVQQGIVADWFVSYQTHLEKLDRNWQQYHRILSDFEADAISIEETYMRLCTLEETARLTAAETEKLEPSSKLHNVNYDLATSIFLKVRRYAEAQHHAIERTAFAAGEKRFGNEPHAMQSRELYEIMVRESPVGLFTGGELAALRDHVDLRE